MHRQEPISATHQMYLKTLLQLCRTHPVGRVRDLADQLGVTPGTVSTALNRLQEMGLVEREHYGGALLTPTGSALAECVDRRFETLKCLLVEVFGLEEAEAESDACLMEHAVGPVTLHRVSKFLDHLHAGKAIDLASLKDLYNDDSAACSDCAAEGTCKATATAAKN